MLGILFATPVRAVVVAKLVMSGIFLFTSFILALREAVVTTLVILGISFLTSFSLPLTLVFAIFIKFLFFSPNDSSLKTMKNAFYFI